MTFAFVAGLVVGALIGGLVGASIALRWAVKQARRTSDRMRVADLGRVAALVAMHDHSHGTDWKVCDCSAAEAIRSEVKR